MPVRVSPKYWAEHVGLPYHQTAIRGLELPKDDAGLDAVLGAQLRIAQSHAVRLRRLPAARTGRTASCTGSSPARTSSCCGAIRSPPRRTRGRSSSAAATGAELFEPLSFKGRRGSGIAGGRCAYADASLTPARDWEKFLYTYRLWGRLLYNPDTPPETWRRLLRTQYGDRRRGRSRTRSATATRILPLVTTAHLPSAAQDTYSPEFYTNQSIVDPTAPSPYGDTPEPKDFGHVSPLDPQLFSTSTSTSATCSPAQRGQVLAGGGRAVARGPRRGGRVREARQAAPRAVGGRIAEAAVPARRHRHRAQAGMGRFFAAKLRERRAVRSSTSRPGDRAALEAARAAVPPGAGGVGADGGGLPPVYVADITFGPLPHQRGHWADRVAAMDTDIAPMERMTLDAAAASARSPSAQRCATRIAQITGRPRARRSRRARAARVVRAGVAARDLTLAVARPASPATVLSATGTSTRASATNAR